MPREDFGIFSSIRSGTWPPTRDSTSVKSGIVSFVFCNRQLCNSFKGSDSMVSGRPQIRDRSSSWNTTSFSSLVRWTSSSIPYPWEIAARKVWNFRESLFQYNDIHDGRTSCEEMDGSVVS